MTLRLQRLRQAALLQVHRNGDSGSPRVVGSTSASRSTSSVGSLEIVLFRPAPGRRIRSDGSSCANSFRPRPIVLGAATPCGHRDRRDPPITRGERLGRRGQTTTPFIKKRGHCRKPLSDGFDIDHHYNI